jgi:hypothetical protein
MFLGESVVKILESGNNFTYTVKKKRRIINLCTLANCPSTLEGFMKAA